ncbi:MAG: hypothetical protein Kow0031_21480 [Anaerolineae bacterium]
MLVIISDLHLTDGTSGETINAGAFKILRERLSDMAYDASKRGDGTYDPIEGIDLLILGDVLDAIRSTRWLEGTVRPWDDPGSREYVAKVREITRAILAQNEASFEVLRSLSHSDSEFEAAVTVPKATRYAQPYQRAHTAPSRRLRVPVRIHYTVGNHDWFYHLPGSEYNDIRREVAEAMGLANNPAEPFWHEPTDSASLMKLYEQHHVFARHGDIYDSFNYDGNRNTSSLGDVVVIELVNRFSKQVDDELGQRLPLACRSGLREIDNVRPNMLVPVWLSCVLEQTLAENDPLKGRIKQIWNKLVDDFFDLPVVKRRDKWGLDDVDKLQVVFNLSRHLSLETAGKIVTQLHEWGLGTLNSNYHQFAATEPAFKDGSARFIVHGHTHHRQIVPMMSREVSRGEFMDQFYMNSGTWRRVHELAKYQPEGQRFLGYHEMTYFAFFKNNERKGRPFEMWGGALGVSPPPAAAGQGHNT